VLSQQTVKGRVSLVDHAVEIATLPADPDIHSDAEGASHSAQNGQGRVASTSAFKATDDFSPDPRAARHISLPQPLPDADDPQRVADPHDVHEAIVADATS
jgi:hypothetical protein